MRALVVEKIGLEWTALTFIEAARPGWFQLRRDRAMWIPHEQRPVIR
jgi:hypothetical protein